VMAPGGLDLAALLSAKASGKSVLATAGAGGHAKLDPAALIGVDCDLLVPAALENMIHGGNAGQVKARVVLELANGPLTAEADAVLQARNIVVLPDILANAGGVTVSYFEWVQNRQGFYWPIEEIHERLRTIMEREGGAIWKVAQDKRIAMRTAAYVHALSRLAEAIEAHGTQSFFTT